MIQKINLELQEHVKKLKELNPSEELYRTLSKLEKDILTCVLRTTMQEVSPQ